MTKTRMKNTMKRIRLLAVLATLLVSVTAPAQQDGGLGRPTVEQHLKLLSEKLGLSAAQQIKAKPILQEMTAALQKINQDDSLSHKEQMDRMKPCREKADKKLRKILNEDQKKKLDELEQQRHPELHDDPKDAAQ